MSKVINIVGINTLEESIFYHNQIINNNSKKVIIEFKNARFIRNNFISIIGMGLEIAKLNGKLIEVKMSKVRKLNEALTNVGFFSEYIKSVNKGKDRYGTMIPYTHVPLIDNSNEIAELYTIFKDRLKKHMGNHSLALQKKIFQKILEIFSNVFRHSQSELGLICSGQFYPNNKKFNFTIVDAGVGIDYNVNEYLRKTHVLNSDTLLKMEKQKFEILNAYESIIWAIQDRHSSTGRGGLGLKLLIDLIEKSDGVLEIISNNGYYSLRKNNEIKKLLTVPFKGTIVSIELNADESKYYYLKEESNEN